MNNQRSSFDQNNSYEIIDRDRWWSKIQGAIAFAKKDILKDDKDIGRKMRYTI